MSTNAVHCQPNRIVVAVDGSARSHRAIPVARAASDRLGVPIELTVLAADPRRQAPIRDALIADDPRLEWPGDGPATNEPALLVTALRPSRLPDPRASSANHLPRITVGRDVRPTANRQLERLVVPLDGTPELDSLIDTAIAWTRNHELGLHILAVAPDEPDPIRPPPDPTARQRFADNPAAHVDHLIASRSTTGIDLKIEALRDRIGLASALQKHLRDTPDAVLLMPASRPRTLRTLIERSTTPAIARTSPVPLMVAPGPTRHEQIG